MPNWCVGTLKVRGKINDLKRFILEGLEPVNVFGQSKEKLQFNEYGECDCNGSCYIKNTHRGFVEDLYVCIDTDDETDVVKTICLDSKFAWGISATDLQKTCREFNVDMKIFAFERGMEFNQNIEIIDGQITKNEDIEFNDYSWECVCPNLGG